MGKRSKKVVFKAYNPDQLSLLPPSLEELIPANHVVRVVQRVVDLLDIDVLLSKYKGGGSSSYHPRMLLKVIIYGYLSNIYSSRKIEQAVASNIHFMWLAGMQRPDHNTINRFRSEKLKGVLKEVFSQVVILMVESGLVDLKTIYVDGTKLEANANKYSFVWGKSIKRNKARIHEQLNDLWKYAEQVAAEELNDNAPTKYTELDAEKVEQTIASINEAIKDKPVDPKVKQKLNYAKRQWPDKLRQYEQQQKQLGDRNSMSKTDPDATFMRMKDDPMRNGHLKPAYNWQISTNNQCIVNYDIFQNPTDTLTLPIHTQSYQQLYGDYPDTLVADAGYGSEENYQLLEDHQVEAYVKYNYFHYEQKSKGRIRPKDCFSQQHLYYNEQQDYYVCPMGQRMEKQYDRKVQKKSGYVQKVRIYQAQRCQGCPLQGACHKTKGNRIVQVNQNLKRHRQQAKHRLLSEQGQFYRSRRPVDVETVFGNIKHNKHFKRFSLRGIEKVYIEAGLIAIAHNLSIMAN